MQSSASKKSLQIWNILFDIVFITSGGSPLQYLTNPRYLINNPATELKAPIKMSPAKIARALSRKKDRLKERKQKHPREEERIGIGQGRLHVLHTREKERSVWCVFVGEAIRLAGYLAQPRLQNTVEPGTFIAALKVNSLGDVATGLEENSERV